MACAAMAREREKRYVHNIPAARRLRGTQTESEGILWGALRDRRFQGLKFRRQHAIGRFVVDFYCHEARLIVEVDGGVHDDAERRAADNERQSLIEELGVRFVRVRAADVVKDVGAILTDLERQVGLSPSPAKSGEGAGG